ncbi:pectinesterase [Drepanopeziza brunnea f. sp. 'multigermtubi' MB_m1]|uniref:Pectinesterase n=1 Tax=Marssonina brunnea f. sp. multigermtubi (strain MB_m1) TaxID=1072389 RepID=K1X8G2_MARBU|nr:pectinesterase [Drepanopeziza brunnea f. sp. 'multigermtubi' MB_m1]EKD16978.1 pectinesterase [Drepanopeziza brunnea f. sp. 'multigermtubi' MB_m1]
MRFILSLSAFVSAVFSAGQTTAPSGAITVSPGGTYSTIQAAVDSLSTSSTTAQSIFNLAGTYKEQVIIPARKATLKIYGYTTDTSSYAINFVTITHSSSLASGAADDEATCTVINEAAVALAAYGDSQGYYGVGLHGYQDTPSPKSATRSTLIAMSREPSTLSSDNMPERNRRKRESHIFGRLLLCDQQVNHRQVSQLDRRATTLGSIINAAEWEFWSSSDDRTDAVAFVEYGNTGTGALEGCASFATKPSSAITISTALGSGCTSWADTKYLS